MHATEFEVAFWRLKSALLLEDIRQYVRHRPIHPSLLKDYNRSQPRVPAGNSDGGQWTGGGSGSSGGASRSRIPSSTSRSSTHTGVAGRQQQRFQLARHHSISDNGVTFVAEHESFRAQQYPDIAGHSTIGYGHKLVPGESYPNGVTEAEAQRLLTHDLRSAQEAVRANVKVPLTQNQFDALTSLTYNIGSGNFAGSTLLRRLNAGDYDAASEQFSVWNKVKIGGKLKPSRGLTNRRNQERDLFLADEDS